MGDEKKIVSELAEILEKMATAQDKETALFKAEKHYQELMKAGLIRKKTNQLRGVENAHLIRSQFNALQKTPPPGSVLIIQLMAAKIH